MIDKKAPKKDKKFIEYWNLYIEDVCGRDNVKPGHLKQLELLCDMYVEYETLSDILIFEGYTYDNHGGRNGDQLKLRPEVQQLNRVRSEIRAYSVMLGLALVKDTAKTKKDSEEW